MNYLGANMKLIVECSQKLVRLGENLWGEEQKLDKAEPLDVPTMTTDFVKEHGLPCPEGYVFKDENGNVINATKIVLEKKKKDVNLTQEQINTMVHDSCVLFCKHCGCGIPRETCTSLGTCKEHDEYRAAIRIHLIEKKKKEYDKGTKVRHKTKGMVETVVGVCKIKYMGAWVDGVIYEGNDANTGEPMTFVRVKEDFENNFEVC